LNQYLDIISSYTEEVDKLIDGARIQMLEHLKIDLQKFEDSLGAIIQSGKMQQLQAVNRQRITYPLNINHIGRASHQKTL
jgi:hypothetical protein